MGYIFAITFYAIPADSVRFADTILGFLLGTVIAVLIQFFYGSSAGSSKKTDMLNTKQL
jgi:multisubunit Na+/H+ antiporter MnhE subunit